MEVSRRRRGTAHLGDSSKKELQPPLPVAIGPYRGQAVVILGPTLLEIHTQVQQRTAQDLALAEKKCNQQAADPAIAIEKRSVAS